MTARSEISKGPCAECGRQMRPRNAFAKDWPGTIPYGSRGMCDRCAHNAAKNDTLLDHETLVNQDWSLVREDLVIILEGMRNIPEVAPSWREGSHHWKHQIAAKLGMKWPSLYQSLRRHNETDLLRRLRATSTARR